MLTHRPDLAKLVSRFDEPGKNNRFLLSLLRRQRMTALLRRMLDETEFLSDYGVRSVSKIHATAPFVYDFEGTRFSVDYEPGESTTTLFGGNSNWRGPIWMPINFLMIEALYEFEKFYEPSTKIECPTGSGHFLTIPQIAAELTRRLTRCSCATRRGGALCSATIRSSRTTRRSATTSRSTNISTATRAPASAPCIRRAGRGSWPCCCSRGSGIRAS